MNKEEILRQYSPLALAYLGDGVYELYVRAYLLKQGNCPNYQLHNKAKHFVSCDAQQRFLEALLPDLHEDERDIIRRGRNAKSHSKPRNALHGTYHAATGFEARWGYLYLAGEQQRLAEIFDKICSFRPE